jgi:MFS family permease
MADEKKPILEANSTTPLLSVTVRNKREILKAKLVYLFYFGASASLTAYLPVYYRQINMNDVQTGILASVKPFVTFVSAPLWGGIADRTGRHKMILLVAVVVYTLLIAAVYPFSLTNDSQIRGIHGNISSNSTDVNLTKAIQLEIENSSTKAKKDTTIFSMVKSPSEEARRENDIQTTATLNDINIDTGNSSSPTNSSTGQSTGLNTELEFWLLFMLLVIAFFFMATLTPIMDATVVTLTTSNNYGKQRLWGAVGFGLFGLISGILASGGKFSAEVNEKANFLPPFVLFVALNALVFIVCWKMKTVEGRQPSPIVFPHIKVLLKNPRVMLFVIVVLIMGISSGVITWFLFLFLKDIGGSQTLLGISIAVSCVSEVLVFLFAGKMIDLLGNSKILLLSLATFIIRLIGYSYLYDPWLVLPIELLHGFTYAAMWSSCVSYGSSISPPEVVTTVIGLLTGVHFGLGWGLGGALGGVVYQYFGPRVLFRGCAVMCGVGMVLQLLTEMVLKRLRH